jgi:hypothetical protein
MKNIRTGATRFWEHDYEPVPGLPAPLPEGETMLWQGAPEWRSLALRAMRVRAIAIYFVALAVWGVFGAHPTFLDMLGSTARLLGLGMVALAVLGLFGWMVARTTLYTITTKRVIMRFGIALPMTLQISYKMIDAANVHVFSDGTGDVSVTLRPSQRVAFLVTWPHTRPWKFARTQPTFRCIPDAAAVAQILGRALAASAAQPATAVANTETARGGRAAVPATA